MTARLDIYVDNIQSLISSGYDVIKVYRSTDSAAGYVEVTDASTRPLLDLDTVRYSYDDSGGNADSWYKWSFLDNAGPVESVLSSPVRASISGSFFRGATYPAELYLTGPQQDTIFRLRQILGDFKSVNRDYISSSTGYDNVSEDLRTVALDNPKGWPLEVSVDGTTYATINDPIVRGYQYLTFSGTSISTVSGTVDIWYDSFRFSDREVLEAYENADVPAGVETSAATVEMYELSAAITLLEAELRSFMATSSSAVSIYEEISINPRAGLDARQKDLDALRKRLKGLVGSATVSNNLTLLGIRVD